MIDRFQLHAVRGAILVMLLAFVLQCGCTRSRYRVQADREANYLVREKSLGTPWEVPDAFTIDPDARSRFFDPTDPDYPTLPPAGPRLYEYQLPELNGRGSGQASDSELETLPRVPPDGSGEQGELPSAPVPEPLVPPSPQGRSDQSSRSGSDSGAWNEEQASATTRDESIQLVAHMDRAARSPAMRGPGGGTSPGRGGLLDDATQTVAWQTDRKPESDPFEAFIQELEESRYNVEGIELPAVQKRFWEDVPPDCLALMLDFESVRRQYAESYEQPPADRLRDQSARATLPDLFELALLNSREYQRQKESLYQAALDVALERYAYATKFSVHGATVDTTFTHARNAGTTVNSLSAPTSLAGNKTLATGGTLVGQFANQVLLTFNGPTGFAADVSSGLLFEVTQHVFQRDIVLESLIQSERDLVYAARDFARYRKTFFLRVAESYYEILRSYRTIEISAQNYFDQVITLQRALMEQESGIRNAPSMVDLNQFERSTLSALSTLIADCNSLEDRLDRLKVLIGIPTETRLNVDLQELQQLTLRDTIEVNRERAARWLGRLENLRGAEDINTAGILAADYSLTERLSYWLWQRNRLDEARQIFKQHVMFRLNAARVDLQSARQDLQGSMAGAREALREAAIDELEDQPVDEPIIRLWQLLDVIESQLALIDQQMRYAAAMDIELDEVENPRGKLESYRKQYQENLDFEALFAGADTEPSEQSEEDDQIKLTDESIRELTESATQLLSKAETLGQSLDNVLFGQAVATVPEEEILRKTDELMEFAERTFSEADGGLPPLDIGVDEAMVTALVQRLDLMNQRGALADDWRTIKIAADELKSNFNIGASQRFDTDTNRPFSFSSDNARTQLQLSYDLPLNRKAERNRYRRSLIQYNAGLRELMEFKDNIKLNVRSQMRDLTQARIRYPLFVSQAALAEEQVLNIQLQIISGLGARALELLDAYGGARTALGSMVDARINYIVQRARFALELEAMMLDDSGYWPEINDPQYQPEANSTYPENAGSAYGTFPSYLKVSREYRRMLNYPPPTERGDTPPEPGRTQLETVPDDTPAGASLESNATQVQDADNS
ncbi:MAG: TolC family protein [Planctomycetota bacterium]